MDTGWSPPWGRCSSCGRKEGDTHEEIRNVVARRGGARAGGRREGAAGPCDGPEIAGEHGPRVPDRGGKRWNDGGRARPVRRGARRERAREAVRPPGGGRPRGGGRPAEAGRAER